MATFSENQVRHLYVASTLVAFNASSAPHLTAGTDNAGKIMVRPYFSDTNVQEGLFIETVNALGEVLRSDLIKYSNILSMKSTAASKMARNLKVVTVTPASVTAGYDYYLRVDFKQFVGQSDADTYAHWASAHAATGATVSSVCKEIAVCLAKSAAKDPVPMIKVYLKASGSDVEVTPTNASSLSGTYTAIVIKEVEQPYRKGIMASLPVLFDAQFSALDNNNNMVVLGNSALPSADRGVAVPTDGDSVNNGKKTADLEYFLLGERGDQYRGIGFPNNVETKGLVDETKAYDYIDIHYYTDECGTNNARSEKDLTIVCPIVSGSSIASSVYSAIDGYVHPVANAD